MIRIYTDLLDLQAELDELYFVWFKLCLNFAFDGLCWVLYKLFPTFHCIRLKKKNSKNHAFLIFFIIGHKYLDFDKTLYCAAIFFLNKYSQLNRKTHWLMHLISICCFIQAII